MAAELAYLRQPGERWRFAAGCAQAVLLAPRVMDIPAPGIAVMVTLVLGVIGCVATTAAVMSMWPSATGIPSHVVTSFVASLVAYLWMAVRPPQALVAHYRAARMGALFGFALFVVGATGRTILDAVVAPANDDVILGLFLAWMAIGTMGGAAFVAARREGVVGAGITAALWVALVCAILAFNADLLGMLTGVGLDVHMRHVVPDHWSTISRAAFLHRHMGEHLEVAMINLHRLPMLGIAVGIVCGVLGSRGRLRGLPLSAGSTLHA